MSLFNKNPQNKDSKKFVFWVDKVIDKKKFNKEIVIKLKTFGIINYSINTFDFKEFFNSIGKISSNSFGNYKTFGRFFTETRIKDNNTYNVIILEKNYKYCDCNEIKDPKSGIISIFYPFDVEWFNNFTSNQKSSSELIMSLISHTNRISNNESSCRCSCKENKSNNNKTSSKRRKVKSE